MLLYCTGGIRCEKASAYLKARGFGDVSQLAGGIIEYAASVQQAAEAGGCDSVELVNRFVGKNFVFDGRMESGERISQEVIGRCEVCGIRADDQINCDFLPCHRLLVQCAACVTALGSCCSEACSRSAAQEPRPTAAVDRLGAMDLDEDHEHAVAAGPRPAPSATFDQSEQEKAAVADHVVSGHVSDAEAERLVPLYAQAIKLLALWAERRFEPGSVRVG